MIYNVLYDSLHVNSSNLGKRLWESQLPKRTTKKKKHGKKSAEHREQEIEKKKIERNVSC